MEEKNQNTSRLIRLSVSFNILNLKILRRKDSRGNETCHLWQRSSSKKLEVDLFEMYISHGGSLFAYFYLFLC